MSRLTDQMKKELERLALLRDDEIDTYDIPEETKWSSGDRSRFHRRIRLSKNYDVRSIANWFIINMASRGKIVTILSLNKLVYFAIERSLVERNVLLSPAKIEAWAHGPVIREVYHSLKGRGDEPISTEIERFSVSERKMVPARDTIDEHDERFLAGIADSYGTLTASQLRNLSHRDNEPWSVVWNKGGNVNPGMEITLDVIEQQAPRRRHVFG